MKSLLVREQVDGSTVLSTKTKYIQGHSTGNILRRYKQFIFILRDTFSSYTTTQLIPNEQHDMIREAIILGISHFRPSNQTPVIIRVDSASGIYALRDDLNA